MGAEAVVRVQCHILCLLLPCQLLKVVDYLYQGCGKQGFFHHNRSTL
jgi:hypothetical protein